MAQTVRIPMVLDFDKALSVYEAFLELRTKDIQYLFGVGPARAKALKMLAKEYAAENGVPEINAATVDTKAAFRAWHIDVKELKRRRNSIRDLGLETQVDALRAGRRRKKCEEGA